MSIERWKMSSFGRCIRVLNRVDQQKIVSVIILQVGIGILDLLGVLTIGLLGALSVSGVQSREPGDRIDTVLRLLHISNLSFQSQASVLAIGAVVLLVSRTFLSIFFTRRILFS